MSKIKNKKIKSNWDVFTVCILAFLILFTVSLFCMFLWAIITSFKSANEFIVYENIMGLPKDWNFSNYSVVWDYTFMGTSWAGKQVYFGFIDFCVNTVLYVFGTAIISTTVPCFVAYVIAKFDFKLSGVIKVIALTVMVLPIIGSSASELQLLQKLGLYNTMWGMYIQKMNFTGLYFFVFIAAFEALPRELYEAAEVDGAGELRIMFRIGVPLVRMTFTTIFLIQFIALWNDYQTVLLYLPSWPTLSYVLYDISLSIEQKYSGMPVKMAGNLLMLMPMVIIFAVFNKKIMGNLTMGGVKG